MFKDFREGSWGWRQRFGQFRGSLFYYALDAAVQNLERGDEFVINIPGCRSSTKLRAGTSDWEVLEEVFVSDELDFDFDREPRYIVDAGANIGLVSVALAERFPYARIVALEVDAENFKLLQFNTRAYENILAVRKGLWSRVAHLEIENPDDEPWAFRVRETDQERADTISAVGIADLFEILETDHIDFLKIDIEGAELDVFSTGTEDWIDRVDCMAIELHDRFRPGCREALTAATQDRGFSWGAVGQFEFLTRAR